MKKVLVFGGAGFLGSFIVKELCDSNFQVVIVGRSKDNIEQLKLCGFPGQVVFKQYNVNSPNLMFDFDFTKYDAIINLIGIAEQRGSNRYTYIHSDFPSKLASLAKKANKKFIHISAFIPENCKTKYAITKQMGEKYMLENNPNVIILRPTLILGAGGALVTDFETMINHLPFVPLLGFGNSKVKPVMAKDVARFIMEAINQNLKGGAYNLSGTEVIRVKDLILKIMGFMNIKRRLLPTPLFVFKFIFFIKQFLPKFIFRTKVTLDIISMAGLDSVPAKNDLPLLVSNPTTIDKEFALIFAKYKLYD